MRQLVRYSKTTVYICFAVFLLLAGISGLWQLISGGSPQLVFAWAHVVVGVMVLAGVYSAKKSKFRRFPSTGKLALAQTACIVIAALLPRLLTICLLRPQPVSDFGTYHAIAEALSHGRMIHADYVAKYPHVIGYASVLAVFYRLLGAHAWVARALNLLISCILTLQLIELGSVLRGRKTGLLWGLLFALLPSMVLYTSILASEMLFSMVLLLALRLLLMAQHSRGGAKLTGCLLTGLLLTCANMVRPLGPVLLLAAGLYWLLFAGGRMRLQMVSFALLLTAYFTGSVGIHAVIGRTVGQEVHTAAIGYTIYIGTNIENGGTWSQEDALVADTVSQFVQEEQKWDNVMWYLAKERLRGYTAGDVLSLLWGKFSNVWGSDDQIVWYIHNGLPDSTSYDAILPELVGMANVSYSVVVAFALAGWLLSRRRRREVLLLVLCILGMAGMYLCTEASGRYSYAGLLLLLFFAAQGIHQCGRLMAKHLSQSNK